MRELKWMAAGFALGCASLLAAQDDAGAKEAAEVSTSTEQERIAAVEAHIEAYRSGDIDRFIATFTPDAEVYSNGIVAKGRDEIRALYRLNFQPGAPKVEIQDCDASGQFVFVSVAYVFSDGREICCSVSEFEVRDGKISYIGAS